MAFFVLHRLTYFIIECLVSNYTAEWLTDSREEEAFTDPAKIEGACPRERYCSHHELSQFPSQPVIVADLLKIWFDEWVKNTLVVELTDYRYPARAYNAVQSDFTP